MKDIRELIRDVPDFPKPGILFRDITPVLADAEATGSVVFALAGLAQLHAPTHILGIESRGFILGTPVALELGLPFVPARKPGKLPYETVRAEYALEYGTDALEMHVDALERGDRVVIIDDLLATGGTAEAACRLVEGRGAIVAAVLIMVELTDLHGAERLRPRPAYSLVKY